jgi:cell division protein FtsW (lipid II flippase)
MVGSLGLLFLYFYLGRYIVSKLQKIRNDHSKILGVGIISLIIVQVFVNIGVNLKIMPNTGQTLPFISYGGTAMMVNLIELVLLYNIIKTKD